MNNITYLPNDILLNIIDNLDNTDTFKLSCVNKFFNNFLINNNKHIKPIILYNSLNINSCTSKYKDINIIYKAYDNFNNINNVNNIITLELNNIYIDDAKISYINTFINVTKLTINCKKCVSLDNLNLNVTELNLYQCDKINYNYLNKCTNLKKIVISGYITDYFLLNSDTLEHLELYYTNIKKCKLICNNLKSLKIRDSNLLSIEDLNLLKKLEDLDLHCNKINNLYGINNLYNLNEINLYKCEELVLLENDLSNIKNISIYYSLKINCLKNLNKVKNLDINHNDNLKTIDLTNSINLETFEIMNNNLLNNIVGINNCIKLKYLCIVNCSAYLDLNLDNNINLEELYLSDYNNKLCLNNNLSLRNLSLKNLSLRNIIINYTNLDYLHLTNIIVNNNILDISNTNIKCLEVKDSKFINININKSINEIKLYDCNELDYINNLDDSDIKYLSINNCANLKINVNLPNLENFDYNNQDTHSFVKKNVLLDFSNCPNIGVIDISGINLYKLILLNNNKLKTFSITKSWIENVYINNCNQLNYLYIDSDSETIKINNINNLEHCHIIDSTINNLDFLKDCNKLKFLILECPNLNNLNVLYNKKYLLELSIEEMNIKNLNIIHTLNNLNNLKIVNCKINGKIFNINTKCCYNLVNKFKKLYKLLFKNNLNNYEKNILCELENDFKDDIGDWNCGVEDWTNERD